MRIARPSLAPAAIALVAFAVPVSASAESAYLGIDSPDISWQPLAQAACLARGDAAIDAALAEFSIAAMDRRHADAFGWYILATDAFRSISVACIPDDDGTDLVSEAGARSLVIVTVSGDIGLEVRDFIVACIASGDCAAAKAPAAVAAGAPPSDAQPIRWVDSAEYLGFRDRLGETFHLFCPATAETDFSFAIYGSDIYTGDSAVCIAALHAGIITTAGGDFVLEPLAGQDSYVGSERNGVPSLAWGSYGNSFRFVTAKAQ